MKRKQTHDRASPDHGFLTNEQIGPNRHMTREGYLLCTGVPFARTGWMQYTDGETRIKAGPNGYTMIERDPEELFRPEVAMSFSGKPITNDHPPRGVDRHNWSQVTVGTVHNVRPGTGDLANCLVADFLITDASAIRDVQAGKVEVSAGYNADYEPIDVGQGKQINIIGNHIALVTKGRCGPQCAIGDSHPSTPKGKAIMPAANTNKRRATVPAEVRQLLLDSRAALDSALDGEGEPGAVEEGDVHVHIHSGGQQEMAAATTADAATDARLKALETGQQLILDALTKMAPKDETEEEKAARIAKEKKDKAAGKTDDDDPEEMMGDSAALERGFKAVLAEAEILFPGYNAPTFDAKAQRAATIDSMCAVRRDVLSHVGATADGKKMLESLTGDSQFKLVGMGCADVASLFRAAASVKRTVTNAAMTGGNLRMADGNPQAPKAMTIADLQKQNREKYPI